MYLFAIASSVTKIKNNYNIKFQKPQCALFLHRRKASLQVKYSWDPFSFFL